MQTIPCETDEPNTGLLEFYIFYGYYFWRYGRTDIN